jgi:hypothetical protein
LRPDALSTGAGTKLRPLTYKPFCFGNRPGRAAAEKIEASCAEVRRVGTIQLQNREPEQWDLTRVYGCVKKNTRELALIPASLF